MNSGSHMVAHKDTIVQSIIQGDSHADVQSVARPVTILLNAHVRSRAIPATRILSFPAKKRNDQYVMCPEQECESLVYHADQSRSMIEVLFLVWINIPSGKPESNLSFPFMVFQVRIQDFQGCMDMGRQRQSEVVHQGFFQPSSKRPANPADRQNPEEKGLRHW